MKQFSKAVMVHILRGRKPSILRVLSTRHQSCDRSSMTFASLFFPVHVAVSELLGGDA